MYLKALEIQGFKSFPEKTRLSFEKDVTVIVGPNGSGKSNISDALLWVMGEQKTRMLRGGKMEDVIFGGTEKRGAMGFAQVTLILDNSARLLPCDSDEVSISRRYYRSGESEYSINRETVRLRDVAELLMDTGLGCDGYSIIGQGRISEIVSAKSTDRREIFEEAAGIARFRHRKDESERKLQRTEENLLRIGDKISELELQVEPLREQAEVAKKYLVLRDELRVEEVSLWMENLDRLHQQAEQLRADYQRALDECQAARAEQDRLYGEAERIAQRMRETDLEAEDMREALRQTEAAAAETDSQAAVLRTNIQNSAEALDRLSREMQEQSDRAQGLLNQVREHQARLEDIDRENLQWEVKARELRRRELDNESGMDQQNRKLAALAAREGALRGGMGEKRTALELLSENLRELEEREEANSRETAAAEEKCRQTREQLQETRRAQAAAEDRARELANAVSGRAMLLESRERTAAELAGERTKRTVELQTMESRIRLLTDLEKAMEGFSQAVKTVTREAERGGLRGIHGPVGKLIQTDDRYALAVETALGAAVGNIVVDTQEDARRAIELLSRRDGGRSTFLPLDVMRPQRLKEDPAGEPGYVGVCAALARCRKEYENIVWNLLGRTVVAETLSDAIPMARKHDNRFRIVTLDGQVVNAGGSLTGGSAAKNTGILSRANELKRLGRDRAALEERLRETERQARAAERDREQIRAQLEDAREEQAAAQQECVRQEGLVSQGETVLTAAEQALEALAAEREDAARRRDDITGRAQEAREALASMEAELAALTRELEEQSAGMEEFTARRRELEEGFSAIRAGQAALEGERNTIRLAMGQLEELRAQLESDSGQRAGAMEAVCRQKEELQAQLEEKAGRLEQLKGTAQGQKQRLGELTARKMELEGRRSTVDKAAQEKNRELLDRERDSARLEQKKLAADMEEKQIVDKLWDSYELSRTAAQQVRRPLESYAAAGRKVAELRRNISALGTPNLGAIDEYKRVSERYGFLTAQRDDVQKSKDEILGIIGDITSQMEEIFVREMDKIDQAFQQIFAELFGGGHASLSLEDANDVLNCGIDIRIQPPGKAVSNISLLSGGEKAFVAIALYFAIMRVRPTPFCVMDEIESALDEENVERFSAYMRRMSEKTQFVAITHRRGTMEAADQLYGVTMQEKGVSTILAMDMEQALKSIH